MSKQDSGTVEVAPLECPPQDNLHTCPLNDPALVSQQTGRPQKLYQLGHSTSPRKGPLERIQVLPAHRDRRHSPAIALEGLAGKRLPRRLPVATIGVDGLDNAVWPVVAPTATRRGYDKSSVLQVDPGQPYRLNLMHTLAVMSTDRDVSLLSH